MKAELKKEIGERLRTVRKTLGFTQEKMVEFFDIGRANYSRIEKGEVWPGVSILHKLRTKFYVSLDWLITNTGKMFTREQDKKAYSDKTEFGDYNEEVKELLSYIDKIPMVKHAMLSYFLEYKVKNQDVLQRFLNESELPDQAQIKVNGDESG